MIIIYVLLSLLMAYFYKKTNIYWSLILGSFIMLIFLNGYDLVAAFNQYISTIVNVLTDSYLLLVFVIASFIFVASDLYSLVNHDIIMEKMIRQRSPKIQKIILVIISILATNFDFTNLNIVKENEDAYTSSSIVLPFLNVFSLFIVFVYALFTVVFQDLKFSVELFQTAIVFNIFALWWLGKQIIDILLNYDLKYKFNQDIVERILPDTNVQKSNSVQIGIKARTQLIVLVVIGVVGLGITYFFFDNNILSLLMVITFMYLCYNFFTAQQCVYKYKLYSEETIYETMYTSFMKIGGEIFSFLLGITFAQIAYTFLNQFETFLEINTSFLFLISSAILIISLFYLLFKTYIIVIVLVLPMVAVIMSEMSVLGESGIFIFFAVFISVITFMQLVTAVDFSRLKLKTINDLVCSGIVLIINIGIIVQTQNWLTLAVVLAVELILYALIIRVFAQGWVNDKA